METVRYTVDLHADRKRVDRFLAERAAALTRSHIKKLIESHLVLVNRIPVKASHRLRQGDVIDLSMPPPREPVITPEAIPLDILFEDKSILVLNKPAGMVVHPAAGNYSGTLVHALLSHCRFLSGIGGVQRPGIVHRLDKDTSGLMVVAKNDAAHQHLARQFKSRAVTKRYQALICGYMRGERGSIELEIGRHRSDRKKMSVHTRKGRAALTEWEVMERFDGCTLLDVGIKTGRTHQIRVHLAAVQHPIVGDSVYGGKKWAAPTADHKRHSELKRLNRPFLHAYLLGFAHPATGQQLLFTQPLPPELEALVTLLRGEPCSLSD
jgi:23S rRNA pseudouridine1911/1915/1917 synthase